MKFNQLIKKLLNKTESREIAKKRLKFALITDKFEVNGDILARLQQDIVEVISRYFEIDRESMNLDIQRLDESSALVFNTPILSARHQREGSAA